METVVDFNQLAGIYRGKKVLLTGHTGFKGAWLVAVLQRMGANVLGYALAPEYENGLYSLLQETTVVPGLIADIRDKKTLSKAIQDFQPDFIFHLAAQPLVRRSYEIPAETFEVNAVGTANLLECVGQLENACTVIVITTDKVYENKEQGTLFTEDDRLGGYDPYSASKACTELVVSSFRNSFFNPATWDKHRKTIFAARAGNVIGGGDWSKDRIIPDIVRALGQKQPIPVRNPAAVRPWQHVLEPIAGYLLLGTLGAGKPTEYSPAYNFGPLPGDHISVRELVEAAIKAWGSGEWKDTSQQDQLHEAGLLQLDIQKAIRELGWEPKLDSSEAVEWTINWYRQQRSSQVAYTIGQIESYFGI